MKLGDIVYHKLSILPFPMVVLSIKPDRDGEIKLRTFDGATRRTPDELTHKRPMIGALLLRLLVPVALGFALGAAII